MRKVRVGAGKPIELGPEEGWAANVFGHGMNCITGKVIHEICVENVKLNTIPVNTQDGGARVVKDSSSYASFVSAAASMSASGMTWSASAAVAFARTQMSSDTYVSFAAMRLIRSDTIYIDQVEAKISAAAIEMIKGEHGPSRFIETYGTHCTIGVAYGGSFVGQCRFETHSASDKTELSIKMSGSISAFGGGGSVTAEFDEELSHVSTYYELNSNYGIVGATTSPFRKNNPDELIAASYNLTLEKGKNGLPNGSPIAFVCVTWDQFPQIAKALQEIGQPHAFDFGDAQANLTTLSGEYAALQYIAGTCDSLIRSRSYAIPSYDVVLRNMLSAANTGQRKITELTIERIARMNAQELAPYLISAQMTPLLDVISHNKVRIQIDYNLDWAFYNGGHISKSWDGGFNGKVEIGSYIHARPEGNDPPQTMRLYLSLWNDGQGPQMRARMNWWDPYGPGSGDYWGNIVNLGSANFPTEASSAVWNAWPDNRMSLRLAGFSPSDLYGGR